MAGDVAERIGGVDADDGETQPIDGVVLDFHLYEHRHAGLECLACLGFEVRHEQFFVACPTGCAHLGCFAFDEVEVQVAAPFAEAAYLGFDPIGRRQTIVQRFAYKGT